MHKTSLPFSRFFLSLALSGALAVSGAQAWAQETGPSRKATVMAQGVSETGLTVRVKGIEMGGDATILTVSVSSGAQRGPLPNLAFDETYLEDPAGNRLPLKRPNDNPKLQIQRGETLNGQLVFLGHVPPATRELRLVINQGSEPDSPVSPHLVIPLALKP